MQAGKPAAADCQTLQNPPAFLLRLKSVRRVPLMKRTEVFQADLLFTTCTTGIRQLDRMTSDGTAGINIIPNSFTSERGWSILGEMANLTKSHI